MADFDVTHSGLPAELETKTEAILRSEGLLREAAVSLKSFMVD